ncbi:MAG: serine hydrolase [Bacteroidota bacterium]
MNLFPRFRFAVFFLAFLSLSQFATAQQTKDWAGDWDGTLKIPGMELAMHIELTSTDAGWVGTLDIPQQMIKGMALSDLSIDGASLSFKLPEVPGQASYDGSWSDGHLEGTFSQGGQSLDLSFDKRDEAAQAALMEKVELIKNLVDSFRQGAEVPGLGLGIFYQDEVLLADGFGYRNMEEEIPATADTRFAIGSSSKAFTSMGLGLLADEGLLEWDEPVQTYLKDFQLYDDFATQEMTTTDLLCHRSGLPRHDLMWYATDFSREELYNRLKYLEPSASFRSTWQYQNLMFMTAGILTERLSGQSWEEYIAASIFQPLGMTSANFSITEMAETDNFAYGYGEEEDEVNRIPYHPLDAIGPAGSINASAADMLKWVELHLGNGEFRGQHFVNAGTLKNMHKPHMLMEQSLLSNPAISYPSYGLGWFTYDYGGLKVVEHGGNIDGFSALVFMIPEKGFGMVTLTNKNGTPLGYVLAYTIADILLDLEGNDWYSDVFDSNEEEEEEEDEEEDETEEEVSTPAPHELKDYVGTYSHPGYGDITVTSEGGELVGTYYDFSGVLKHQQFDYWKGETDDAIAVDLRFETDRNGQITAAHTLLELSLSEIRFERQPDDKLSDPDFLNTLCGTYELDGGVEIKISLEGTSLKGDIAGQPTYTLEPKQGNSFALAGLEGFVIEFLFEGDEVTALVSHQPNGDFRADRVD